MLLAGSGAVAAAIAGCGSSQTSTTSLRKLPRAARAADIEILNAALALENRTVSAYTAGIPLLSGTAQKAAQQFLGQHLTHAGELSGLVKQAGGKPVKFRSDYNLGNPRNGTEVLDLLRMVESTMIATYLNAIPRLTPGPVRAAIASLLANDAQHISVLRAIVGLAPIPSAFVTGRE